MKIQSVQRAIDIMSLFSKSHSAYRLTDIAKSLDLRVSTVHGIVSTLEQNGLLINDRRTRQYRLGSKVYELGSYYASTLEINLHANNLAKRLAQQTNCGIRVGIWDQNSVLITLFAFPQGTLSTAHNFGPRVTPYCTAIGRVILAFLDNETRMTYLKNEQFASHTKQTLTNIDEILRDLDDIRETGYAVNRGEYMHGRAGLAAPIWGPGKTLEGALVITGKADEILGDRLDALTNELLHTCSQISESMGFSPEDLSTMEKAGAQA